MKLEALLSGSIALASHANGFAGTPLSRILEELCYELQLSSSPTFLVDVPMEIFEILSTIIPFLAPSNQS